MYAAEGRAEPALSGVKWLCNPSGSEKCVLQGLDMPRWDMIPLIFIWILDKLLY